MVRLLLQRASQLVQKRPVLSASTALTIKYIVADIIAQNASNPEDNIDFQRMGLFAVYGGYYGVVNYHVFRALSLIPWSGRLVGAVGMTFLDSVVHMPCFYMPQFYCVKELVLSGSIPNKEERRVPAILTLTLTSHLAVVP